MEEIDKKIAIPIKEDFLVEVDMVNVVVNSVVEVGNFIVMYALMKTT